MTRYYSIEIENEDGSPFATFTSFPGGVNDPSAQHVEFDVPVWALATPNGAVSIRIWGVSLTQISQASDYNGKGVKLFGGMQKGLPLANPDQAGLLAQGTIYQAWGNWIGTSQYVQFTVIANGAALGEKLNIVLDWKKGETLGAAVTRCLQTACPGFTVDDQTSSNLVLATDETGFYNSLISFAAYVKQVSSALLGIDYRGVDILIRESGFVLFDGTFPGAPLQISFNDLIGQPTWIDPGTVQVTCVMRADLQPTDYVLLPPGFGTLAPSNANVVPKDRSVFQGAFLIVEMRHLGAFREPDAMAWITTMNCTPAPA